MSTSVPTTNGSLRNEGELISADKHETGSGSGSYGHIYPTQFPALTGRRPRAASGQRGSVSLDSTLNLNDLCASTTSLGVHPVTALQLTWAILLSAYTSSQEDIVFATATRQAEDIRSFGGDNGIWHTAQTRICLGISGNRFHSSVRSVLQELAASGRSSFSQNQTPESAAIQNDQCRHSTTVAFTQEPCSGAVDSNPCPYSGYNVEIVLRPDATGRLIFRVSYLDQLLDRSSALVMLTQMDDIMAFILTKPGEPINSWFLAIRATLLSTSNEDLDEGKGLTQNCQGLHGQFEEVARCSPDRVALIFEQNLETVDRDVNVSWTYRQLDQKAQHLANYLSNRFGKLLDTIVPICMDRRPELYVAILGVLKAGGAWSPIDPSFPARRRHNLIARTCARIVIVAERKLVEDTEGIPEGVDTINITQLGRTAPDPPQTSRPKSSNLAYLIWTSGTTGDPKGVPISHGAAVASMQAIQKSIPTDGDGGIVRCLQFSQFTFDVFVQDLFYTWGIGGTLIASTRAIMLGSFPQLATKTEATHCHLTPAFAANVERKKCPTLQVITMIGEKLTQTVADEWSQSTRAFNTYGPAESTVVSTLRQFGGVGDEVQSHNIGYPLPSVSAFIIRNEHPVMRQGIGELALGGPQLSKGYWDDLQKSSERFVWNERYNRHLYMTGDVARQLHDGSFEFVGRTDDLIKIQGIRIELSEIAFSLRHCHPSVEQVDIQYFKRHDRPSKVLVAFLAAPQLSHANEAECVTLINADAAQISRLALEEAKKILPEYMIPSVPIVVNGIPRTSSAKIDRAALKTFYETLDIGSWERQLAFHNTEEAAWGPHESATMQILAKVSGTSQVSINRASTLNSIGVDSIRATRLVALLNTRGLSLSILDILRCQNVGDVLTLTERATAKSITEPYPVAAFHDRWWPKVKTKLSAPDAIVVPALPIQESLLSETMQNPQAYWSNAIFAFNGNIDIPRLRKAWLQVANNTESLRTAFLPSAEVSGELVEEPVSNSAFLQVINAEPHLDWEVLQPGETSLSEQAHQRAKAIAKKSQESHFQNPLWAVTVLDKQDRCEMMVTLHHAIRDEPSLDYLLADVCQTYKAHDNLIKPRPQLRQALEVLLPTSDQIAQDEKYWMTVLADYASQESHVWPDLTGKRAVEGDAAAGLFTQRMQLTTPYEDLRVAAISLGPSSVASLFRFAWGCILLDYLEAETAVFGETNSDRVNFPALRDTVGPLLSVIPVPFKIRGSIREMLVAQSSFQLESRAHRSVHPRFVRKVLRRSRTDVLYPAIFNYLPETFDVDNSKDGISWKRLDDLTKLTVEHPLALNVIQVPNGALQLEIVASESVMSHSHVLLLAQQVEAIVGTMIEWPDMLARDIASKIPRHLLSISSVVPSQAVTLAHRQSPTHWVDHFAAEHPDWLAVQVVSSLHQPETLSEKWTFRELYDESTRVANFLQQVNNRGKMIAVCLDSRLEAYAVILGILKSGHTYLPIDQSLPKERKLFLLNDSAATMLFTTGQLAREFLNTSSRCHVVVVDHNDYLRHDPTDLATKGESSICHQENAYLLYTSGSTGIPKGVLVGRGNLSSFVEGLSEYIHPLTPENDKLPGKGRYLGLASRAFDVHLAEMFLAWRRGMAVVTGPRKVLLDDLETALRNLEITHASFVPSLIDHAGMDPANLPNLRYLGIGGEKMSNMVIDTWASIKSVAVVNPYGPTELSIGCCAAQVTADSNARNVGRPFGNSVAHVLIPGTDAYTMRGVAGELCVTGDLVANGYYNRPDAKGFVEDFGGLRMYRTGDIVRLMADDSVEFIGRQDDQTKIRGQRLELGEISGVIRNFAMSKLALANIEVISIVTQHSASSRPQLVAFLVPDRYSGRRQESPDILRSPDACRLGAKIHAHCQEVLPTYMVPDAVVILTALPIAPSSGKADVKNLKALFSGIPLEHIISNNSTGVSHLTKTTVRELSEVEKAVRLAVSTTLHVSETEILHDTNLFRLGLDSLTAISLAIRLQKLGFVCTVANVLKKSVLEHLASLPRDSKHGRIALDKYEQARRTFLGLQVRFRATPHSLDESSILAVRPCLPLQESVVASSLSDSSNPLYVNHITLELSIEVDHDRLLGAWERTIADHEILRTCFQEFEGGFVQVTLKLDDIRSRYWKAIEGPQSDAIFYQKELTKDIISNISTETPLRLVLIRSTSNNGRFSLLISIHHALYDAESLKLMLDEVYARYCSAPFQLRTPFSSLLEYVSAQDLDQSRTFWVDYLADYRPSASIRLTECQDDNIPMPFEKSLTNTLSEITELASSLHCTTASVCQAVFGIVLARVLGVNDVVFGAVLSGRTVPVESPNSILAPCTTTIPQRMDMRAHDSSVVDLITSAQKKIIRSLEFQHTALRDIHRWMRADKPLFDCLFSYIRKQQPGDQSDLWTEAGSSMPAEFPFAVEAQADTEADQLVANCTFTSAFGNEVRVESFVNEMDNLLATLVNREDVSITRSISSNTKEPDSVLSNTPSDELSEIAEEQLMRTIISEICEVKIAHISRRISFFSLGIDSIIAIRFARKLRQNGMLCSSADVMRHPSIAALTEYIKALPLVQSRNTERNMTQPEKSVRQLSNSAVNKSGSIMYPCIPMQSSMLTQTLGSDGKLYANHHAFRLLKNTIVEMLKKSWEFVVRQTETLRTSFHFSKSRNIWEAKVHEDHQSLWTEIVHTTAVSESWSEVVDGFSFREDTDFRSPPWKVTLVKAATDTVFILSIHHSLYDGKSIRLLLNDLAQVYRAINIRPRPPFSLAAREISGCRSEADAFWLKRLDGFESNDSADNSESADVAVTEVETALAVDLGVVLRKCKELGVTLQTVALLAFGKTLASTSTRRDVVFGRLVGGRSLAVPAAEDIVGPLFNTVPFRLTFDNPADTNSNILSGIQRFSGHSLPYHHASLAHIQQIWRQRTGNAKIHLLDDLFVFQRATQEGTAGSQIMEPLDIGSIAAPTEYSTNLEFEQRDDKIIVRMIARKTQRHISNWLAHFQEIFRRTVENPHEGVLSFPSSFQSLPLTFQGHSSEANTPEDIRSGLDLDGIRSVLSEASGLSLDRIGPDTSIFALGLDSISTIRVAAACRKRGFSIGVADVMQGQTAGGICRRLRAGNAESTFAPATESALVSSALKSKALEIVNKPDKLVEDVLPCLSGQIYHLAMWLKSGRTMCEATFTYRCSEKLNIGKVKGAWDKLRQHHPILRTIFVAMSGRDVVQVVLNDSYMPDNSVQSLNAPDSMKDNILEVVEQTMREPFDLFTIPARLKVVQGKHGDCILLTLHHATYDAWTIEPLIRDLTLLYRDIEPPYIPALRPYIEHTSRSLHSDSAKAYWRKSLPNKIPTILQTSSDKSTSTTSSRIFFFLDNAISQLQDVESTCQSLSLSFPIILFLAYARTIARYTSQSSPTFGLFQTGRSSVFEGVDKICAPLLNVTPLQVPNSLTESPLAAACALQSDLAERVPFEQNSLHDISAYAGIQDRIPIFNCYINILWQDAPGTHSSAAEKVEELLTPWSIGDPADVLPKEQMTREKTAVDSLDTSFLANENLFLDIKRDGGKDALDFAARCDRGVMDEDDLRKFMQGMVQEVDWLAKTMAKEIGNK